MADPKPVKIAFQGGGAKLVTLLECALYLKELQDKNIIQILAVSGTSAGAIVAGLVALNADFEKIKQHLIENKKTYIKKFKIPNKAASILKIFRGNPIIDHKHVEDSIAKLFEIGTGNSTHVFEKSPIPLSIVVADLVKGGKYVFSKESSAQASIVKSIVHSCSIPFLFRTHNQSQEYADGGICENLPIEELTVEDGVYNIALGFESDSKETFPRFDGIMAYAGKVIAAAIDHNVTRSELSNVCDQVVKLPNNVSTTEFEKAFEEFESTSHRTLVRKEIDEHIVELELRAREDEQRRRLQNLNRFRVEKQFENAQEALKLLEHNKVRFLERGIAITPYCLEDKYSVQRDKISQFYRLIPEERLFGIQIELATPLIGDDEKFYTIVVQDVEAKQIVESIPIELTRERTTEMGNKAIDVFVYCKDGLSPEREYHIVVDYGLPNAFSDLKVEGKDYLVIHNSNKQKVVYEKVTMIFFCPPNYKGKIKLRHYADLSDQQEGYEICEGALIETSTDLYDYANSYGKEGDFEPHIWVYNNGLGYKQSTGVLVVSTVKTNNKC